MPYELDPKDAAWLRAEEQREELERYWRREKVKTTLTISALPMFWAVGFWFMMQDQGPETQTAVGYLDAFIRGSPLIVVGVIITCIYRSFENDKPR